MGGKMLKIKQEENNESEKCSCGGCFTRNVSLRLQPGDIVIPKTQLAYYSGMARWAWKIDDETNKKLLQSNFLHSKEREITITCLTCGESIVLKSSPVSMGKCCVSAYGVAFLRLDPPEK